MPRAIIAMYGMHLRVCAYACAHIHPALAFDGLTQTLSTWLIQPRRFFEDYKKNENKEVVVADEIKGREAAMKVVKESLVSVWAGNEACFGWATKHAD